MKIYIDHFNLDALPELLKNINEYQTSSEEYIQIYSNDGIYLVDSHATIRLKPVDHDIIVLKKYYQDFTLIVDPSFFMVEKAGQIPSEHHAIKMKKDMFALHQKSPVKLVIESEYFFDKYIPNNIYFELPNGSHVSDTLVKEEIIVFFSVFN
jgi:hypothetical protein